MTFGRDPYAVLGLEAGASQAEVKRAYRRLAKAFHPDAAGPAAMPRFLAIQAAYERLTGDTPAAPDGRRTSRREPWRADATRDAWQARGARRSGRAGATGTGRRAGTADSGAGPSEPGNRPPGSRRGRSRSGDQARDKATPGSTSYDDAEPFDREWSGASWYGQSSGTYWTINPKEYADPRKHGPEYQARARRAGKSTGAYDGEPAPAPTRETAHAEPGTTVGGGAGAEWSDTAPAADVAAEPPSAPAHPTPVEPLPYLPLPGLSGGAGARIAVALLGWPPIGLTLAWLLGEASGCSRFAAVCTGPTEALTLGTWLGQIVIVSLLLLVPRLAAIASVGTLGALVAAIPGTILLSASGGARQPEVSAIVLAAFLVLGWIGGVAFAIAGRSRTIRA